MSNFGDMWQEVRLSVGDRKDIDTEIKSALNDAMIDIGMMFRIRQLITPNTITTTEGDTEYVLATEVLDVINVRNDDKHIPLEKGDSHEYDSLEHDNSDKYGEPRKWFVDGNNLVLYNQTSDDSEFSVTYRYVLRLSDMINNADVFPLPREWVRPTKLLAKSYVFELLGQGDKALAAFQQMSATVATRNIGGYYEKIHAKTSSVDFGYYVEDF